MVIGPAIRRTPCPAITIAMCRPMFTGMDMFKYMRIATRRDTGTNAGTNTEAD